MSGIYSVEDLLKLRASPLICKPPSLPPIEEWMGSQEPSTKRPTTRGKQDDSHLQTEGFQKRPTLDSSLRKSTTDPERIVLGPPRRSFASSNARNLGKVGTNDPEEILKEGFGRHERRKTGEDLENKFGDRRSGQFINGRYSNRHDQDHERPRRKHEEEDVTDRPKRDQDRPTRNREEKANEEVDEGHNTKTGFKRDQTRSRFEQSWLRSDRGTEEARRENDRSGWRRDRARDGDWDIPGKGDADPEWMDAPVVAEPVQAHTQEDFQRWKEKMKAAANGPAEEKQEIPATIVATANDSTKQSTSTSLAGFKSPELNADSMDKFFAKFTEKRVAKEDKGPVAKPATKSKFASLFSPPPEMKLEPVSLPAMPASPIAAAPPSAKLPLTGPLPSVEPPGLNTEADQAGFKRILEMLGKRDATPSSDLSKPKPNPPSIDQHQQERHQSPDLVALFKQSQPSRTTPLSQPPPGLERLIESRSPAEGHRRQETPNKDELLLNLLRQADISAKPPQQPQREYSEQRPPPGLFASMNEPTRSEPRRIHEERSDIERQGHIPQQSGGRSMFDDPAISGISYQDDMGMRQGIQRRPTGGYEDLYYDRLRQQDQQKPLQPPPGMPRPPGLEQMSRMPPGWPGQPPLPQQHQPRQAPPPGIGVPQGAQRGYVTSQQQPPPPPMSQPGQRPPQRKYTGDSAIPNYPPGIGPPPGFVNNGPPPGFHHNGAPNQAPNYARYAMSSEGHGPPQQQGPPNMGRAFMEMYGNAERSGLRSGNGGVPLPPGFR